MAKSRRKGKPKSASIRKDKSESVPKGTARRTLSKARFFLRQAGYAERRRDVETSAFEFECYVEAALFFARSALGHLRREFTHIKKKSGRYEDFGKNLDLREQKPLIKDLIDKRDDLAHKGPISLVPSDEVDIFYGPLKEDYEKLPAQLDEIEAIIEDCYRDERFK